MLASELGKGMLTLGTRSEAILRSSTRHRLESVLKRQHPEHIIRVRFIIAIDKMAAIVLPAARRHTSTVIVMHGLGDRYVK